MPDLTIQDVAALTAVHPETLRRLARAGRLPGAYKIGRQWRIAAEALARVRGEVQRSCYSPGETALGDIEWEPERAFQLPDLPVGKSRPAKPGK